MVQLLDSHIAYVCASLVAPGGAVPLVPANGARATVPSLQGTNTIRRVSHGHPDVSGRMGRTAAKATTDRSWTRWGRRRGDGGRPATTPGRQSLQGRILSRALLIAVVPLLLISSVTLGSLLGLSNSAANSLERSREELGQDVAGRTVRASAVGVAREMEQLLAERIDDLVGIAAAPGVRGAARRAAVTTGDTLATRPTDELETQFDDDRRLRAGSQIERFLRATTRRQAMLSELFFTERNGLNVAASGRTSDFVQREEAWWNGAWDDGLFLGEVEFDESAETTGLTVAVRIDSTSGRKLGVLKGVVDIAQLQQIATRKANDTGTDVSVLAVDGQLMAETRTDHNTDRIANGEPEFDGDSADAVGTALDSDAAGFVLGDAAVAGFATLSDADGRLATSLEQYDGVDATPVEWTVLVEQTNEAAFASLSGLAAVQRGLSSTARTFVIIILLTLLASLIAAFVVSSRLAQRIVEPLRSLGAIARDIAERQLPTLVRQAQRADAGDELPVVATAQLHTNDEIEDVADAFNIVSTTAADLAAEQAKSRRNVARMFVSLGRRNQNLLSRQLQMIDRLERDTSDADLLKDLFSLDHLATRMRRNAESLLVLAGEDPPRRWTEPVSLTAAVRAAVGEIEDYRRVNVDGVDEASLVGTAVSDVTHLLAELIENAAQFSPPDSMVEIVGRRVVDGYALAIVDDGVGMSNEQLDDANRRLEMSPLVDRVPSSYLGLFVVGRLASRHGIQVRLVESTTEGVTAKVLLPTALVEPLPKSAGRELSTGRRPALESGASAAAGSRAEFAGAGRSGAEASTAVLDPPPAATPPDDAATQRDQTQPIALGPRRERAIGRRTDRRAAQVDLRHRDDDEPADDEPSTTVSDRDDRAGDDTSPPRSRRTADSEGTPAGSVVTSDDPDAGASGVGETAQQPVGATSEGGAMVADDDVTTVDVDVATADVDVATADDDGSDADSDPSGAAGAAPGAQQSAPQRPAIEVRRRQSKRSDTNDTDVQDRRAVLRTEAQVDRTTAEPTSPVSTQDDVPVPSSNAGPTVDDDGVALTAAEQEARATRNRLASFQRAVQRGRAQTRNTHNGGEHKDA